LATHPEPSLRNGPEAVALAKRAIKLSGDRDPYLLDTLAAAYAESGRYDDATAAAERAVAAAEAMRNATLAETIKGRLKLYRQKKPFRETSTAYKNN
jgi:hypothetical protein